MIKFVVKRLLMMIPVLLGVMLFIFVVSRLSGDPVLVVLGGDYTQEQYDAVKESMGLNDPYPVQFFNYIKGVVTEFDLGTSYQNNQPVRDEVLKRLPISIGLAMIGVVIAVVIGIPLGVTSAVKQNSIVDYIVTLFAMASSAMPSFWLAFMLIIFFSLNLGWFPASGIDGIKSWILPALALGIMPIATVCRTTRSNMLESIRQDYIRTARAKGVSERKVIYKHALKNSIIPVLTILGVIVGVSVGNSVVLETVFGIPGIGSLMMTAINAKDYPTIQGSVLVFSIVVCMVNLIIDILYGFVDPRIKAQYTRGNTRKKVQKAEDLKVPEKEGAA